jgi:CRP-like cAMP-binding protein
MKNWINYITIKYANSIKEEKFFIMKKENTLQISLTREELANIVRTATESVIRLLSEFKKAALIELNGRKNKNP